MNLVPQIQFWREIKSPAQTVSLNLTPAITVSYSLLLSWLDRMQLLPAADGISCPRLAEDPFSLVFFSESG